MTTYFSTETTVTPSQPSRFLLKSCSSLKSNSLPVSKDTSCIFASCSRSINITSNTAPLTARPNSSDLLAMTLSLMRREKPEEEEEKSSFWWKLSLRQALLQENLRDNPVRRVLLRSGLQTENWRPGSRPRLAWLLSVRSPFEPTHSCSPLNHAARVNSQDVSLLNFVMDASGWSHRNPPIELNIPKSRTTRHYVLPYVTQ